NTNKQQQKHNSTQEAARARPTRGAGVPAYFFGPTVVFYLLAATSLASVVSVLAIPGHEIDDELARGLHDKEDRDAAADGGDTPSGWSVLVTCKPLLVFAFR